MCFRDSGWEKRRWKGEVECESEGEGGVTYQTYKNISGYLSRGFSPGKSANVCLYSPVFPDPESEAKARINYVNR
ncbi:hypothetical protein E2C01_006271 [Portunus trituberculatus]|uniref:Uncharacterized protein n=1 Tax=Portunus trituberculatus TaxID=210409 RepID=A0A5B7D1C3_PORTR|nr:hypothetical protein [Portunus trituberculatus]